MHNTRSHNTHMQNHMIGLTNSMLRDKPMFDVVAPKLNEWFKTQMRDFTEGVLVSHNTPVDIQYLLCEYIRCGLKLPSNIRLGLDTLSTLNLNRFSTICYRKVPTAEWTCVTAKGKNSMGIKPALLTR